MEIKTNQLLMLLATLGFILLIKNLFLLRSIQSAGYLVNIYPMFPLSFYLTLMSCYLVASFLLLKGKMVLGAFILCLNHFEILIIPYMLGYYSMGRADDMSYIGEYLQIATSGHFAGWDIYPDSHIIGANILLISNLYVNQVSFIIPIVFSFLFIAGIYLFSREIFPNNCIQSLVVVSSFVLYLGSYNFSKSPNALFFSLMPLYLYFFYKYMMTDNDVSHSIILVLMTLIIPFAHPFIVFFVLVVLLFHSIPIILPKSNMNISRIWAVNMRIFLLLVFSFVSWLFYNEFLSVTFKQCYIGFINKLTEPVFVEATNSFGKIGLSFFDYVQLVSLYFGRYIIPTFFIFISIIYLYFHKDLFENKIFKNYRYLFAFYIVLLCTQLILLFNPIIAHTLDRIANLNFIVYAQIPLFACALYLLFLKESESISRILLVCGILLFIWSLSLFGCFDSPYVFHPNVALTYNEVQGMSWLYKVKSEYSIVAAPLSQIYRFRDLFGNYGIYDRPYLFSDHFGYNSSYNSLLDINSDLDRNSYIIILTIDELLYQKIPGFKNVGRYTKEDFNKFRNDISVNKIYDNINIEINKV